MLKHGGFTRGLHTSFVVLGVDTSVGLCLYPEEALMLAAVVSEGGSVSFDASIRIKHP